MGHEKLKRKDFLKSFAGFTKNRTAVFADQPTGDPDPLFEKYARKTLGPRQYSNAMEMPGSGPVEYIRVTAVTSGLAPYVGVWTTWEVTHLLRRLSFGVKKADLDTLSAMAPVKEPFL